MNVAIAIAIIVLALLGKPLLAVSRRAYAALAAILPRVSSPGSVFTASIELPLWKVAALVLAFAMLGQRGCELPKVPDWKWPSFPSILAPAKVTAATYVFEKDETAVPSGVMAALSKLNERGITATTFEDDTTDASGEVPEQYKVALAESKKQGVPLLVVQSGATVVRTVKAPTTAAQVLEAVP